MPTAPRMLLERQEEFREAVKKSRGRVVVLVHPYYVAADDTESAKEFQKLVQYQRVRSLLLKRSNIPVVILEERHKVPETHLRTRSSNTFFIETYQANPDPIAGWKPLHDIFKESEVDTVLIGGMQARKLDARDIARRQALDFWAAEALRRERQAVQQHESKLKKPPHKMLIEGCAGAAYSNFIRAGHPTVRWLPNLAYPERPHDK